jgi:hypothetical protein
VPPSSAVANFTRLRPSSRAVLPSPFASQTASTTCVRRAASEGVNEARVVAGDRGQS